ncbi:GNAT family N-acetyltransferase [Roseovarius sp. MMSF_3281]|uniref:GNAT family N-acetyltransferase n=1 Tax=Roseovarius sp. MMSF_3281 TaxID=3046694 RepID=UPI00273FFA29|nr:GNAT family N-acetyltransferase [Roseovarius sp. MMSF_3281]
MQKIRNQTPHIRPLQPQDRPAWEVLFTAYLRFYETSASEEVMAETFRRLISDEHPAQYALLAEVKGQACGLVQCIEHPHNWRLEPVCYLQDLFVSDDHRGLGLGRALIEAVYAEADRRGTPSVYWMTQDFNATARQLYDRVGQLTPFIKYVRS